MFTTMDFVPKQSGTVPREKRLAEDEEIVSCASLAHGMEPMDLHESVQEEGEDFKNTSLMSSISESLKEFFNITEPNPECGEPSAEPTPPGPKVSTRSRLERWEERRLRLALRRHGGLKDSVLAAVTQEYEEDEIDGRVQFEQAFPCIGRKKPVRSYVQDLLVSWRHPLGSSPTVAQDWPASPTTPVPFTRSRSFPPSASTEAIVSPDVMNEGDVVDLPSPETVTALRDGQRIGDRHLTTLQDNSDRRRFGQGLLGRLLHRQLDHSVVTQPHVKKQLDDLTDFRPYFTYWISFVHVLVMALTLLWYGIGPFGAGLAQRSGLVMTEFLTLEEVDVRAPANFWLGPPAQDLIHLGAKYTPCMRPDPEILNLFEKEREQEISHTGCCIKNDRAGCVQTTRDQCSPLLSTFVKWNRTHPGPEGRTSGPVCGLDPSYCLNPISSGIATWPDHIGNWPICAQSVMDDEDYSIGAPSHMSCEVLAKPCCIGIHGRCQLRSEEFCSWVGGSFHKEASLCSQVSCVEHVCGMLPFAQTDVPDQFYRVWTSLFLNAGLFQVVLVVFVQLYLMRDLEKMCGWVRITIIYMGSGVMGNLASAIFIPYRAECGPSGALFGILAAFTMEVVKAWPLLKRPSWALMELLGIMFVLMLFGLVPWVDNYAHVFGFITGLFLSYAILPHISLSPVPESVMQQIVRIVIPLATVFLMFMSLTLILYVLPIGDCEICKMLSCIPIVSDFCAEQNIDFSTRVRSLF